MNNVTGEPRPNVVTDGPGLSSPVTPVHKLRIGAGGEDEQILKHRLRMHAMAIPDIVEGAVGGCESPGPRTRERGDGGPSPSGGVSRVSDAVHSQERSAPSHMSPVGQESHGHSQITTPAGGRTQQGSEVGAPHSPYVLNQIILENELGVHPVDHVPYHADGSDAGGVHTLPQHKPPRCGSFGTAGIGTPSPATGRSRSRQVPSTADAGAPTPTGVSARSGSPSPNNDPWGETETEWLCRFRNEVKDMMGNETETYGRARLKEGFWKIVEQRMRDKGYNRKDDECKNKFNQILDFYRRLKANERWSGYPSYWDMNSARRKRYNVDFVLRRSWYDIIDPAEKDKDSINLTNLLDSGADEERVEDNEEARDADGGEDGGGEDTVPGAGGSTGGLQGIGFEPTLGKRKRSSVNVREASV
ncbi:hypothetical protein CBR_g34481 [Chara braunii]|uniref:Myb-like domain-containing protein n=1 Tax=Chara braunii TaxID=69332 RepID=A0A388LIQ4_CHABU|nr:hypothetical protein CBR_g34481 [Chara braunii]|eukprot:GBG82199.1 hypothetical protein CBR_g34481 [Chara braunii]